MNQNEIRQALSSPEGKRLLELLNQDGGTALRQAGQAVQNGNEAGAQQILQPMLQDPEIQKLLKSLERSLNHG